MNKYQKYILLDRSDFINNCISNKTGKSSKFDFDAESDTLTIYQDNDIELIDGALYYSKIYKVKFVSYFETIEAIDENNRISQLPCSVWCNGLKSGIVVFDFDNRISKIKFRFARDIAEPYILKIKYVSIENNKQCLDEFYCKQKEQLIAERIKKACIKTAVGRDLLNVYFQPCDNAYKETEINLYYDFGSGNSKNPQEIACYKSDKNKFFISVGDLAFGNYLFKLKQIDNLNNLLFETDFIKFCIEPPKQSSGWQVG